MNAAHVGRAPIHVFFLSVLTTVKTCVLGCQFTTDNCVVIQVFRIMIHVGSLVAFTCAVLWKSDYK